MNLLSYHDHEGSRVNHGKMAKQKKKKIRSLNFNETTDKNKVESDSESSSQEEDSTKTTLTSKRKPNTISPPENQTKSKIVNCTTTPKATSNNSTSSNDSERLIVDESNQTNEELNSTALSNTDNVTKDLRYDTNTSFNDYWTTHPNEEFDDEPKTIEKYTLQLPSVRDAMEPTETQETKEERIARKGKYAMAVLNSPLGSSNHTREKELQHSTKEHGKTLYGSYEIVEGNDSFSSLDLLQVIVNHIDQKNIEAFYKTVEGKFIVVVVNS